MTPSVACECGVSVEREPAAAAVRRYVQSRWLFSSCGLQTRRWYTSLVYAAEMCDHDDGTA